MITTNHLDFPSALKSQVEQSATAAQPEKGALQGVILYLAIALGAVIMLHLIIRKFAALKSDRAAEQKATTPPPDGKIQSALSNDASADAASDKENQKSQTATQEGLGSINASGQAKWTATERFIEIAPERITEIRKLFSEVSRTANETARQQTLEELCGRVRALRLLCDAPELHAIDKLVANLEELFKQTAGKSSALTPSVMRTAAGAIVLLESLCHPGHHLESIFDPPPRFLTVDDDPICRRAVASSLKKAFKEPDVAEQGQIAVTLAAGKPYDVVFLDVEMPGMDGFEVCTKIHQSETNAGTPVVFVTSHSDFDSRAKSAEAGGHDLIGKPFVPMELTVKALTLLIKRRLQTGGLKPAPVVKAKPAVKASEPVAVASSTGADAGNKVAESAVSAAPIKPIEAKQEIAAASAPAQASPNAPEKQPAPAPETPAPVTPLPATANGQDRALALMAHIARELSRLRSQLVAASQASEPAAIADILGEFYVRIHSLSGEADQANLRAVYHLTWGLEKLTRKLLEKPTESSASILHTARAALDVIEELCGRKAKWDPCNPPIRILVVDDDPIALRAMSNALQLGFGRPDTAQSGEAAIAATSEKEYDVIFLDVLMPGMDGFAACPKIRETNLNPTTPVLFVTSLADASAREKSERAGGNGFILKPVIPAEIALTALTWALRARLDKGEPKAAQPRPEPAVV